jgi:hypothetical protein
MVPRRDSLGGACVRIPESTKFLIEDLKAQADTASIEFADEPLAVQDLVELEAVAVIERYANALRSIADGEVDDPQLTAILALMEPT